MIAFTSISRSTHPNAVDLVDRLAQLGLVERQEDPDDHRLVRVGLTPQADAVLRELSAAHFKELRAIRPAPLALLHLFDAPPT